jgi:uncharacterized membrane protein
MDIELNSKLRRFSTGALLALIVLCVLWETVVAPVRPGGSWLLLKALPLAFALRGVARGNLYTCQWTAMLLLLYVMEGAVRVMSDPVPLSRLCAGLELALAVSCFLSLIFYVRPAKRARKLEAKALRPGAQP